MSRRTHSRGAFVACLFLAGMLGCRSLGKPTDELLANLSFHILVNEEEPIPTLGTFAFETKLFKVDYSQEIDLAAIDERVIASIEDQLKSSGFQPTTDAPDLLVSYAVAMDAPISGSELNAAYTDEFPIDVPVAEQGREPNYHQGTLIVDFVDRKSRKLLWRGAITADVSLEVSEREKDRRVRHGVQTLLAHFPTPIQEGI